METADLEICADCVIGIEYGHVEGADDEWPGIHAEWDGWNVTNGRRCPEPWQVGTVSHGTMRPEDLIPAFEAECRRVSVDLPADPVDADHEDADEYLSELFDALDRESPEGFYFGAHFGDGSDFGLWPVEDDHNEFARFHCDCCGRRIAGAMHFGTAWK